MAEHNSKALVLCLVQSLAGVILGWGTSEGSGLFNMPSYIRRFGTCTADICTLSPTRQSAITGMLGLGAILGSVGSGSIASRFGLRTTCIAFILVHMIGAAIETSGQVYQQIYVARLLTGLGIGATSGLVPVFQAESAPPLYRGLITGSFQLCVTMGIWIISMVNWVMSTHSGDMTWRVPVGLQMAFDLILLIAFVSAPESPRFLAKSGRWIECRHSLSRLRGLPYTDPQIDYEITQVQVKVAMEQARGQPRYIECFSTHDRILWRTMIGLVVQFGQQATGVNFYFSYGIQFAKTAGLTNAYVFQIIIASVNVIMSLPGLIAVERLGRRPVLLLGALLMFAGQLIVGAISNAHPLDPTAGYILIGFTCLFVASFAASWGPVSWVVCAETFPIRLSSLCVTMGAGANWLANLIIAFAAPQIQARIGTSVTFVWAGCLALAFIFVFLCVPETAGLTIEEVDAIYLSGTPAWRTSRSLRSLAPPDLESHLGSGVQTTLASSTSLEHEKEIKNASQSHIGTNDRNSLDHDGPHREETVL